MKTLEDALTFNWKEIQEKIEKIRKEVEERFQISISDLPSREERILNELEEYIKNKKNNF